MSVGIWHRAISVEQCSKVYNNALQWLIMYCAVLHCVVQLLVTVVYYSYMLQSVGLGKLRPNVLLMGFKSNWQTASVDEVADYFAIIK